MVISYMYAYAFWYNYSYKFGHSVCTPVNVNISYYKKWPII